MYFCVFLGKFLGKQQAEMEVAASWANSTVHFGNFLGNQLLFCETIFCCNEMKAAWAGICPEMNSCYPGQAAIK
jgi:hypothetical protein